MTKNFLAMLSAMGLFTTVFVAGCDAPLCAGTGECLVGDVCVKPIDAEKGMCSPDRCADSIWNTCPMGNTCADIGKAQPLCFPPGTPVDPCATDNGGCGSPDAWECLWQTSRVQCLPKGSVKCTADDGSTCSTAQYCDMPVGICRTRIPVGVGDCARDRMCVQGATCNMSTKKCEGVVKSCSKHTDCPSEQFCNFSTASCVTDHKVNDVCDVGSTMSMPGTSTPEECATNRCNADLRCGCNSTTDCTNAGLNGFICDGSNRCVVDPGQANNDWVKICMTCADPAGCRAYAFDNSPASFSSSPDFVAKGAETCVTLKYGVCSTLSIPLTSASYGPGSTSTMPYALPADKRLPGVQLQVCDKSSVTPDCFAGIERGAGYMFPAMVSGIRIVGIGTNPLVTKGPQPYNLLTEVYAQKTTAPGMTSRDGNPYVSLGQLGCPQ